jgi:hypothetical protein
VLLAVGHAQLHARPLVGDAPVEHDHEHVTVQDLLPVELEHGMASPFGGHRVVGGGLPIPAVTLREEHPKTDASSLAVNRTLKCFSPFENRGPAR